MKTKSLVTLGLTVLNWLAALMGVVMLCTGFSFLPALFGINQPPLHFLEIGGVEFSKGVAGAFPFSWSIGILVVGTFLYTWICSIFSMSTHLMIVSFVNEFTMGDQDGAQPAWMVVGILGLISTIVFVYILYGTLFNLLAISLTMLLATVISFILVLNYTDSRGYGVEMDFLLK